MAVSKVRYIRLANKTHPTAMKFNSVMVSIKEKMARTLDMFDVITSVLLVITSNVNKLCVILSLVSTNVS